MKSNLPDSNPERINPAARALLKQDGIYFCLAPKSPAVEMMKKILGMHALSLVLVQGGKLYAMRISHQMDPDEVPAVIEFSGPINPP